jgi:hypothetical protein
VRNSLKTQGKRVFVNLLYSINCALFVTLPLQVLCLQSVPQNVPGGVPRTPATYLKRYLKFAA